MLPLHPEALLELEQAIAYHERERRSFGAKLYAEVRRTISLAAAFPQSGSAVVGLAERFDTRQHAVSRFRYVVITALIRRDRHVIAVAHTSRTPGYWRERIVG